MNYLLILIILIFIWRMADGYRLGTVKELQAFITFLVSAVSIALICKAINAYMQNEKITTVIAVLVLIILGIGFRLLKLVFFSAKTIAKLPVIHFADKILGIAMGAVEVIVLLWAFYIVLDTFQLGIFARLAEAYIKDSEFLMYFYNNNFLKEILEQLSVATIAAIE